MAGLAPAVLLGGLLYRADERAGRNLDEATSVPAASSGAAAAPTPVLSVRRSPTTLARTAVRQQYRLALQDLVGGIDERSCLAVSLDGEPLVGAGADRALVPASTLKVVTASVALEVLGPDHVFVTGVAGALSGDTVAGDLFLVGGGDATLATDAYPATQDYPPEPHTSLDRLADQVVAAGVRRVEGGVVGDEGRYDRQRGNPRWQAGIFREEAGPLSALLVDDGYLAPDAALPAEDPAVSAAVLFQTLLEARGVRFGGGATSGATPPGTPSLTTIESVPLGVLVGELLTTSDDNTAELLLKEIGLARSGEGSTEAGLTVVRETLAAWGVPTAGLELVDGSGLSDANRITCTALVAVLDRLGPAGPVFDGLPVAGRTGTLAAFFVASPLDGVLRAKTGNLSVARALAGYVPDGDHDLSFALLVNGSDNDARAEGVLWPRLAAAVGAAGGTPDPSVLGPLG